MLDPRPTQPVRPPSWPCTRTSSSAAGYCMFCPSRFRRPQDAALHPLPARRIRRTRAQAPRTASLHLRLLRRPAHLPARDQTHLSNAWPAMKPLPCIKPASPPLANTISRAVFRERASSKPRKTRRLGANPRRQPACALKPVSPSSSVSRTAVRCGSQPPQTCLNRRSTFYRVRKRLILNL
jgi:hypothetical protein